MESKYNYLSGCLPFGAVCFWVNAVKTKRTGTLLKNFVKLNWRLEINE